MASAVGTVNVKDLVGKLNAEKTKAAREAQERYERELVEYEAQMAKQQATEAQRQVDAAAAKQRARAEEAAKWKVDEAAAADEVARMKKEFIDKHKPRKVAKPTVVADVTPIVIDVGSSTIKAGYGGEDAPRFVFSAVVGRVENTHIMDLTKHKHVEKDVYVGDECWIYKDLLKIRRVVRNGVVQDWGDFVELLRHLFFVEMALTPAKLAEYPVFLVEPALNPKANRERLMKTVFDHFPVPAVYVANTATLGLYATGAVTGVVVECGYDVSLSVAVFEGEVVPGSLRRLDVAGRDLDLYLIRLLNDRGYRFNEQVILDGFVIRDLKESICVVAPSKDKQIKDGDEVDYDTRSHGNDLLPGFARKQFPDHLRVGPERTRCAEALFDPGAYLGRDHILNGIDSMVLDTVKSVPIDLARVMYANIVLSGGTTLLKGFSARLRSELAQKLPAGVDIQIKEPHNRHLSVWVGASVLSSSKTFNFFWISREEYERYGIALVHAP